MNPNKTDNYGRTPLHWAAREGHTETAKALLEAGADVNKADKNGSTPLHEAADIGLMEIAGALIEAGANYTRKDDNGNTPLRLAVLNGYEDINLEMIEYLERTIEDREERAWNFALSLKRQNLPLLTREMIMKKSKLPYV